MEHTKENRIIGFGNAEKDKLREEAESEINTIGISNHLKAGEQFALASQFHYEAARLHKEGDHEKANQSALLASGHAYNANEYQILDAKHHAINS